MDALKALIEDAVLADDNKMYSNNQFQNNFNVDQGGMGGSLYGLKPFVEDRVAYMDQQLDCTPSSDVLDFAAETTLVFPNPASHEVTVVSHPLASGLRVVDSMGREMCSLERSESIRIDVSSWSNGVFWVQSLHDGALMTVPFMVQH